MKEKFARWHILCLNYIKHDWKKIIIWVVLLAIFSGGLIPAFVEMAKGQGLVGMYETLKNPAMISMVGPTPVKVASDYTLGAMYAHEMLLFCGLFAMIISSLHVVGHTRKQEENGLMEMVRSFQVGRQANSVAVLVEIIGINILLAVVTTIIMMLPNADTITFEGSLLYSCSLGIAGIIGGVIALVMAQLNQSSSGANGFSLAIIGLLYIGRGGTDVSSPELSMFNPMGWTYMTYPFTENRWYPLLFAIIFCGILAILSFTLEGGRDMGAGYLHVKEGRSHAKKSLLSVPGLFMRLNKGILISWLVSDVVLGAAYGSIYGDMQSFLESNQLVERMFTMSGISIEASFTSVIMMVMILITCILPIAVVNKLFVEEEKMNLSQIYATKITRAELYWTTILISTGSALVGILMAAIGLGGTALSVLSDQSTMVFGDFLKAGYNFLPAVLFFIGLAALTLGWIPKLGKVIYVYLGYSFAINYFGAMLDLPEWFNKTAIFSWIPRMPAAEFDLLIWCSIAVISIGMIVVGFFGYNKRDRIEGA